MRSKLIPVIISGGAGSRLWPVSREANPKPFLEVADGRTLLQKTFERAAGLADAEEVLTIINKNVFFRARDDYAALPKQGLETSYILEPMGRNTATAVAMAAQYASEHIGDDAVLLVLPADHLIENTAAFAEAVTQATQLAQDGYLATFGITPTRPETGYGYIEIGEAIGAPDVVADGNVVRKLRPATLFHAKRFVEKPDVRTAQEYVTSRRYVWNSGMFCFTAKAVIAGFENHAPDVIAAARAAFYASPMRTDQGDRVMDLNAGVFASAPDISIDYALMERATNVAVVTGGFDWNDIGDWSALGELTQPDKLGNRIEGNVVLHDVRNCTIRSEPGTHDRIVGAAGVEDLVIVDTPDALLVAHKDNTQDVRHLVKQLKKSGHETALLHKTVHRPWGTYTVLEQGKGFKIKRIEVKPGASLSLQMHHHRSEHWVVVSGLAEITNGDNTFLLKANESTFIAQGNKHRLANPGKVDLIMIEVQSGAYLGEDDIVRFEDRYGRMAERKN